MLQGVNPTKWGIIELKNALYIPTLDINIISGVKHYAAKGVLIKNQLWSASRKCIGIFNFEKYGFFLPQKGIDTPLLHQPCSHYTVTNSITVEVPSPTNPADYSDPEDTTITPVPTTATSKEPVEATSPTTQPSAITTSEDPIEVTNPTPAPIATDTEYQKLL